MVLCPPCSMALQQSAMHGCRAASDLILNEREERTDDQGQPILDQSRHLVAEALASTRWHEAEHISTLQCGIDDFPLHWPVKAASGSTYTSAYNMSSTTIWNRKPTANHFGQISSAACACQSRQMVLTAGILVLDSVNTCIAH